MVTPTKQTLTTFEIITIDDDILALPKRPKDIEIECFIIPQGRIARRKQVQF